MLNKLLKRCMPWMDKGRWYSIRVVGSDPTNLRTVFNSDEILSAEISTDDSVTMTITTKHIPHIIDYKFCPENNYRSMTIPNLYISTMGDQVFDVVIDGPGVYWFFMTLAI